MRTPLPIDPFLPKIRAALESFPNLVLQASPGSGKTTRVPADLLSSRFLAGKKILVLEPRRLAAKWAAHRVAEERESRLGEEVGYQFRFENVSSARTRLKFLTEGMLMRQMLSDPQLRDAGAVVLDEFHERHLHGDLALGYLRWIQKEARPDLRIVVMSATLETESLSRFLGSPGTGNPTCPVISVETRLHPVEIEHLRAPPSKPLEVLVRDAVGTSLSRAGDILVFLPGMAEIRRSADALQALAASRELRILPLHGELSREEQDAAMLPAKSRKVILATNVAETSLTIEGVTTVIDSGLHRIASHSWWSGVPSLKTRPVSQASAIQRAGRAGRTAPGACLRLFTREDFLSRPPFQTPEIRRADLAQTALELKALGIRVLAAFPWFEAPESRSLEAAEQLLVRLGAIERAGGGLTETGARMKNLPVHPRLGRMLVEARKSGILSEAASLAALISEGELEGFDALDALDAAARMPSGLRARLRRLEDQMRSALRAEGGASSSDQKDDPERRKLRYALLCGFPDRIGKRRGEELLLSSGGSARLLREKADLIPPDGLVIALDLQETQRLGDARSSTQVRSVCPIEPEWLFDLVPTAIAEKDEMSWDAKAQRVFASSRITYDALTLSESRIADPDPRLRARMLAKVALALDLEALQEQMAWPAILLPVRTSLAGEETAGELETFIARLQALGVAPSPAGFGKLIASVLEGAASLDDVRAISWAETLTGAMEGDQPGIGSRLSQGAPTHFEFPNGKRGRIHYPLDQPPWLEAPLQFFFGVKQPPAIAGGRIALVLHLLAPNQRAVQVTSDLPGFWKRVYPEIRPQLSRRYPRHSWPEDPANAAPVKR